MDKKLQISNADFQRHIKFLRPIPYFALNNKFLFPHPTTHSQLIAHLQ
jgi:hypothetical protein